MHLNGDKYKKFHLMYLPSVIIRDHKLLFNLERNIIQGPIISQHILTLKKQPFRPFLVLFVLFTILETRRTPFYLGFENPGVQLPESIITWVAIRGMPEFMMNLRLDYYLDNLDNFMHIKV